MSSIPVWLLVDVNNWAYADHYGAGANAAGVFEARLELCQRMLEPNRIVFCYDSKVSFRRELDPSYKANRDERPVEISALLETVKGIARDHEIDNVEVEGFEADDVIASITETILPHNQRVLIASSDKDLRQLLVPKQVSQMTKIVHGPPAKGTYFKAETLWERYQLTPSQWVDYQALVGDATDNIKGCPGIGPKAAEKLLRAAGTAEGHFSCETPAKLNKTQQANLESFVAYGLDQNRQLVRLRKDVQGWWNR